MGGGLLQLVAYGAQDIYLTGNPQITFFKIVYRRHTNFSMECIKQTINGSSTVSDTYVTAGTVTISRNGDLLSQIYVKTDQETTSGINGDYLVQDVEIEIGGQRMDKHYREWNQIWTELTTPSSKAEGFKYLTGGFKNPLVTGGLASSGGTSQQSVMYPLQFWFCRNIGLALPLIALQYHDVKLKFNWGSGAAADGMSRSGAAAVTPAVQVWCDYIYLDTDERRRFAQVSHEYLIEQLQLQEEGSSRENFKLNFDHPIKELIWTVPTSTTEASTIISQKMKVEINGHDRFAFQDKEYFQIKQPLIHHTSVPGYNIKEKDTLELIQPITIAYRDAGTATGTDVTTLHNTVGSTSGTKTIFNFLIGTNFIPAVTSSNFPKVGDLLRIEVKDQDEATVVRLRNITAQVTSVAAQTNGWNIGLSVEDDQDAIASGFLVGTANDDLVSISIIARLQNPKSRCSQLDRDIFVYSFALNPEEHQPSGACNFSRIESAKFLLDSAGTISNIYATNYNVLRIMSGMGGLAYAI
tara:strand:- start:1726 stop:3297 length:1572 start_codon:yes stop_codon:yes gene_type:complete